MRMVIELPDKIKLDMKWKSISYIKGDMQIIFEIIPMYEESDIVIIPNRERWKVINDTFNYEEREEIIFLIERIDWKRTVNIVEMDVAPKLISVNQSYIRKGSLESTEAGKKLEEANLFDPGQAMTKDQVKQLYYKLESRFAENASGNVEIIKEYIVKDSILDKIIIPILKSNSRVNLRLISL